LDGPARGDDETVRVELLYFDGCPNWREADRRLSAALDELGSDEVVTYGKVSDPDEAERLQFGGSPTILIDGRDPFAEPDAPVGMSCRVFRTDEGLAGAPTVEQLVQVLAAA
jgi:hypothetical protein